MLSAIILAAGRGSRLGSLTASLPKSLLPIGPLVLGSGEDTCFLRRQLDCLQACGVERVVVVVGYRSEQVRSAVREWNPDACIVENPSTDMEASGSLHSLRLALEAAPGLLDGVSPVLFMDADIVYSKQALTDFIDAGTASALQFCGDTRKDSEEVLLFGTEERPVCLGKGLADVVGDSVPCLGESTGIVKIGPEEHDLVFRASEWFVGSKGRPAFGPAGQASEHEELSQLLCTLGRIRALPMAAGSVFTEVDTPEDYRVLRESTYPMLLRREASM